MYCLLNMMIVHSYVKLSQGKLIANPQNVTPPIVAVGRLNSIEKIVINYDKLKRFHLFFGGLL